MSVHEETRKDGTTVYKVRWRQNGVQRCKTFNSRTLGGRRHAYRAAKDYDARQARAQALGQPDPHTIGRVTLIEYADAWWDRYATPKLAASTLENYALELDLRIIPRFGATSLRDITPAAVEAWIADLARTGTGDPTILKTLAVLSGILKRAVIDGELTANPVAAVAKPRQRRTRNPRPIAPVYVERTRRHLEAAGRHGDSVLVAVLAYTGPRPESEALPLTWGQVRHRTLLIEASKRHGLKRTVPIVGPLAKDLAAWKLQSKRTGDSQLVFPHASGGVSVTGRPWTGSAWDNWRDRVYRPAAVAAGLPADTRPRDLRGSYASLCIQAGLSVVEVARRMGHSAVTLLEDYADVFDEFDPARRVDVDVAIRQARRASVFPAGSREEQEALAL